MTGANDEADSASGGRHDVVAFVAAILADVATEADALNALDGAAGDGDLGLTVRAAADAIARLATDAAPPTTTDAIRAIGSELARAAPSTSGTLLAFGCLAAAAAPVDASADPTTELAGRLEAGLASIAKRGKSVTGEKTMLDALDPAVSAIRAGAAAGSSLGEALAAAAPAATAGAAATAAMTAVHGRAGWLAERSQGHEDPGAHLVALLFEAAARRIRA